MSINLRETKRKTSNNVISDHRTKALHVSSWNSFGFILWPNNGHSDKTPYFEGFLKLVWLFSHRKKMWWLWWFMQVWIEFLLSWLHLFWVILSLVVLWTKFTQKHTIIKCQSDGVRPYLLWFWCSCTHKIMVNFLPFQQDRSRWWKKVVFSLVSFSKRSSHQGTASLISCSMLHEYFVSLRV